MSSFPRLNLLVAYPYCKKHMMEFLMSSGCQEVSDILLDSGAFTAWKAGKPIELNTYMNFLRELPFKPYRYFTLDVIGDAKKTRENYERLLECGFDPIPIFTRGEQFDELEKYYERTDYIAVGGLVGTQGNHGFVKSLMKRIGRRKVHLLGYTNPLVVKAFRPFSVDSSSWSTGLRFASIKLYMGGGRWHTITKKKMMKAPAPDIVKALNSYEVNFSDLASSKNWVNRSDGVGIVEKLAYRSFVRYSVEVERAIGTKYFVAVGDSNQIRHMHNAYIWVKQKYGGQL